MKRGFPFLGLLSPRTHKTKTETWGQSVFVLDIVFHWNFCSVCYTTCPTEYVLDSWDRLFSELSTSQRGLCLLSSLLLFSLPSSLLSLHLSQLVSLSQSVSISLFSLSTFHPVALIQSCQHFGFLSLLCFSSLK